MIFEKSDTLTIDEFLLIAQDREDRLELIEGEIFEMDAPTIRHQDRVLLIAIYLYGLGKGKVIIAPVDVVLDSRNTLQPDVLWIAPNSICQILEKRVVGAPDLIVEILSPSTARNDKQKKFRVYQRNGVREYWIIDPIGLYLEQWVLSEEKFVLQDVFADDDVFNSPILEAEVRVSELLKQA
jgi:Uma2 family endonuclease